jgi:hypothetical protein
LHRHRRIHQRIPPRRGDGNRRRLGGVRGDFPTLHLPHHVCAEDALAKRAAFLAQIIELLFLATLTVMTVAGFFMVYTVW